MDKKSAEAEATTNESIAYSGDGGRGDETKTIPKEKEEERLSSLPERVLHFATKFVDWIVTGKKKATTRVDKFVFLEEDGITTYQENVGDLKNGMKLLAVDDDDERPFAILLVTNVEKRTYGSLDDNIAQIENFKNKNDLCDALGGFYKDLKEDSELVVIYFDVLRSLL